MSCAGCVASVEKALMPRTIAIDTHKNDENEINLTPMLDVVIIMLIFFVVTASFMVETGSCISKPDSRQEPVALIIIRWC